MRSRKELTPDDREKAAIKDILHSLNKHKCTSRVAIRGNNISDRFAAWIIRLLKVTLHIRIVALQDQNPK